MQKHMLSLVRVPTITVKPYRIPKALSSSSSLFCIRKKLRKRKIRPALALNSNQNHQTMIVIATKFSRLASLLASMLSNIDLQTPLHPITSTALTAYLYKKSGHMQT